MKNVKTYSSSPTNSPSGLTISKNEMTHVERKTIKDQMQFLKRKKKLSRSPLSEEGFLWLHCEV